MTNHGSDNRRLQLRVKTAFDGPALLREIADIVETQVPGRLPPPNAPRLRKLADDLDQLDRLREACEAAEKFIQTDYRHRTISSTSPVLAVINQLTVALANTTGKE